jgi:hypothetical protein
VSPERWAEPVVEAALTSPTPELDALPTPAVPLGAQSMVPPALTPVRPPAPEPVRAIEPPSPEFEEFVVSTDSVVGLQMETLTTSENAQVEDDVVAHVTRGRWRGAKSCSSSEAADCGTERGSAYDSR